MRRVSTGFLWFEGVDINRRFESLECARNWDPHLLHDEFDVTLLRHQRAGRRKCGNRRERDRKVATNVDLYIFSLVFVFLKNFNAHNRALVAKRPRIASFTQEPDEQLTSTGPYNKP